MVLNFTNKIAKNDIFNSGIIRRSGGDFEENHYEGEIEVPGPPGSTGSTAWTYPGTTASDGTYGTFAWADPNNAQASDDANASFTSNALNSSEYLKCTNFSFSLPTGVTITGIEIKIERTADFVDEVKDDVIKLVIGGSVVGNSLAVENSWNTTEENFTYGDQSNLWGNSISKAQVESADFGVVLSAAIYAGGGTNTPLVDSVAIKVYYST